MKNNKGFTIIEILGAVVILGIITTAAIAAYSQYRKQSADDSYKMMSQNAATAAEEYFLDHMTKNEVTFETLINEEYIERTIDPLKSDNVCGGKVEKYGTEKGENGTLDITSLKVVVECDKYESCEVYPSKMKCDKDDGLITNGTTESYSFGLDNYDFGSNMSMVIKVKFNETGKWIEYFGNWEVAGGGLGLEDKTDKFYFNLYSKSNHNYYSMKSSQIAYQNRWYIVVGVLETPPMTTCGEQHGKLKLYVNGELQKKDNGDTFTLFPGGCIEPSPAVMMVGANPTPGSDIPRLPAPITVSHALIFNRALTQNEVTNYFSNPNEPINYNNSDALVNKKF